jgi:hypothetical protein
VSFLARLQAEPWYSDVADEFASVAPDVPAPLWQGEILSEDSALDPTQQDYLHSGHFGLFQENADFPTSVGLPPATTAQLQNPEYNAYVAALRMEQALKQTGASTFTTQVEALEQAGWPGAVSSGETSTRVANVNQIVSEASGNQDSIAGIVGSGNLAGIIPGIGALIQGKGWNSANQAARSANSSANAGLATAATSLGQSIFVGGAIIAFIAGGFALLAASVSSGSGSRPVPVPV